MLSSLLSPTLHLKQKPKSREASGSSQACSLFCSDFSPDECSERGRAAKPPPESAVGVRLICHGGSGDRPWHIGPCCIPSNFFFFLQQEQSNHGKYFEIGE